MVKKCLIFLSEDEHVIMLVFHGRVLSDETNNSGGIHSGGGARRHRNGFLAIFISEDVGIGQISGSFHLASGRTDHFVGELTVEVTAQAAVLGTVGGWDHVGDVVTSVAEVEPQHGHLDEVASADFGDDEVCHDAVLVREDVGLVVLDLDDLTGSTDLYSLVDRFELHMVTASVDFDSQWQGFVGLLGEDGVTGLSRAVGRDQSVAAGGFVVESDVVEGDDGFGSDVAHTDQTGFESEQAVGRDTCVPQSRLEAHDPVDIIVVTVHERCVDVDVGGRFFEFNFHINVTRVVVDLDFVRQATMSSVHVPESGQTSLEGRVHSVQDFHTSWGEVGVVNVKVIQTRSSVFHDGINASLYNKTAQ